MIHIRRPWIRHVSSLFPQLWVLHHKLKILDQMQKFAPHIMTHLSDHVLRRATSVIFRHAENRPHRLKRAVEHVLFVSHEAVQGVWTEHHYVVA